MERRILIFVDHTGKVVFKKTTDSSLIHSLPEVGHEVYCEYTHLEQKHIISGIVKKVQFDYISSTVNIYINSDE